MKTAAQVANDLKSLKWKLREVDQIGLVSSNW